MPKEQPMPLTNIAESTGDVIVVDQAFDRFMKEGSCILGEYDPDIRRGIVLKLIEAGRGDSVAYNLDKFQGLDHNEIALKIIESGGG